MLLSPVDVSVSLHGPIQDFSDAARQGCCTKFQARIHIYRPLRGVCVPTKHLQTTLPNKPCTCTVWRVKRLQNLYGFDNWDGGTK